MDQTSYYPKIFNQNSFSTTYIEPAISAPGESHPYILSNEMQELSHPGGDIFHGGFRNELSASSETFSGSLHMNNDFESPIFTDNDFQSLVHLDFPILQNENNVYPNTVPSENAIVQSSSHGKKNRSKETSEADRSTIRTLANTGMSRRNISNLLHLTERQVQYALTHSVTPKKNTTGRKHAISDNTAQELVNWVLSNSSHRHAKFSEIPALAPQLNLVNVGEKAIRSALMRTGYERRVAKKKVICTSDDHKTARLNFARWGLSWSRERLYNQSFSDEMWASGGVNSRSFVTVLVKGDKEDVVRDRYHPDHLIRKCSKLPSWMFHGMIYNGRKAFGTFWEKEYGNMESVGYDTHILSRVEAFFLNERAHGRWPVFQHDNAPCHKSRMTTENLQRREIPTINWPPYSPDLNLIEHVWARMKIFIQADYRRCRYDPQRIALTDLRALILAAWDEVPDDFITKLYDSWWDRCRAVIEAEGGVTKY